MKFTVDKKTILPALIEMSRSLPMNANPDILSGIKITASPEGLHLVVSNHDFILEKCIPVYPDGKLKIIHSGSVVIPGKYFLELIKKLPEEITIERLHTHGKLSIRSEEISIALSLFKHEEYPVMPVLNISGKLQVPAGSLIDMVKKTAFAASTNDIRPVLTGMLFSVKDKKITCAATNSHRLAMKEVQIETCIEGSSIVPLSSIKELQRLFSDSHEMMEIGVAENFLIFKSPLCSFYTRLIEGNYPNLDTLVPNDTKTVLTLSTTLLLKGIERASLFSRDASNYNVKLELIDESNLKISSKSTDLGKIEETQQVIRLEGDTDISISLNSQFLMEALRTITDQEVSIHFSGSMRPVLITPGDKSRHMHLISPVRG